MAAARKAARERKKRRLIRRRELFGGKPGFDKRGNACPIGKIKRRIVRLLGLRDRRRNGTLCRLGIYCPRWREIGPHEGNLAYHIVPQNEGEAARLDPDNVVWACDSVNNAERRRRAYFASVHVQVFGQDFMNRRWEIALSTKHDAKRADLIGVLAELESRRLEDGPGTC